MQVRGMRWVFGARGMRGAHGIYVSRHARDSLGRVVHVARAACCPALRAVACGCMVCVLTHEQITCYILQHCLYSN